MEEEQITASSAEVPTAGLLYDSPIEEPELDRLDRRDFAKALAAAILSMDAREGFVFALQGPWGSGKSTILNFVERYVAQNPAGSEPVLVVRFNPWWFSGRDQLLEQFFRQFRAVVGSQDRGGDFKAIAKNIDLLANILAPVAWIPNVGTYASKARDLLQSVGRSAKAAGQALDRDVHEVRRAIDDALRKGNRRILVIVDDIDRLPANEIRELFMLVKAIADFPKTLYLLSFDRRLVVKALEKDQEGFGSDYLSKIVQAAFDLPPPSRVLLQKLLFEQLDSVLSHTPEHLFDRVQWGNLFWDGIDQFISTPRDIKRLINGLRPTYPQVRGEVSAHEFVALQALRVFTPDFYSALASAKADLAGVSSSSRYDSQAAQKAARALFDSMLDLVPDAHRETVSDSMRRLFPRWAEAYGDAHYGSQWLSRWRREGRACSPDVFDLYFQLAVPADAMSLTEIRGILAMANDPSVFGARLVELARQATPTGSSRVQLALEAIQDYTEDGIALDSIGPILKALYDVGDQLIIESDEGGMFDLGNRMRMARITYQLLKRLPDSASRADTLRQAFESGASVGMVAYEVALNEPREDANQTERLLEATHVAELKELALAKIRTAAEAGRLDKIPNTAQIIHFWKDSESDAAKHYVAGLLATDQGFARVVAMFSSHSHSHTLGDRVGSRSLRIHVPTLTELAGQTADALAARASQILANTPGWLDETSKVALSALVEEVESPRDEFGIPRNRGRS